MLFRNTSTLFKSFNKFSKQQIFAFSSVRDNLKNKLGEQLQYEEQNKPEVNQYINFFNNNGWDINYIGTQVELTRKSAPYNLKVLFNARPPSVQEGDEQGNDNEPDMQDDDMSEISVYICKEGQNRWMAVEFYVSEQNSEMYNVRFIDNYENERKDRFHERVDATKYPGPALHSLEESLSDNLGQFIESLGIDHALLQNASNFSVAYEHQFYIEWLKDLKSIL